MRYNRARRGVSEIVGVLLMLAIVVTLGVLIFTLASGDMNGLSQSYAAAMSGKASALQQRLAVEQVAFTIGSSAGLALDGTSTNDVVGSSSTIGTTVTTTSAADVVVAYVSPAEAGATSPPSVSGVSGGGLTWTHRATSPTVTDDNDFLQITLTNSQTSATPTSFQQQITFDPATYAAYEASDLGNIRFCLDDACATPLYSWLESCTSTCGTSATSATAWVNLGTNTIGATGGTLTIYMVFEPTSTEFDGVYWGEAPTLSPTYGQYDNGANVFAAYFNGNTPTVDFTVYTGGTSTLAATQVTNVLGPGGATINAIQIAGAASAHKPDFSFNKALSNTGVIAETSFALEADTNDATGVTGLGDSATANSVANAISVGEGDGSDYFYQGYDAAGTVNFPENGSPGGGAPAAGTWLYSSLTYTGAAEASFYAQTTPALYGVPGQTAGTGYSGTYTVANPLSAATNIYLGSIGGSSAVQVYYNWMRARAYPPAGVMPAVSSGNIDVSTFDVEEWYATTASALTSATITATLSASDTANTWIAVFGISGANTVTPFDTNPSLPATSSGSATSTTMSTSNPNDILLYACAAATGGMPGGYTSVYSDSFAPQQNEYVGYQTVSAAQSNLATSCGGAGTYGAEITDAVVAFTAGADLYVRNVGAAPATIVSVYVTDLTSDTFVTQATISTTVNVGTFAEIPHSTLTFTPSHGHTYSFIVTSSLGNSVEYNKEAT